MCFIVKFCATLYVIHYYNRSHPNFIFESYSVQCWLLTFVDFVLVEPCCCF